jgi:Domain of unknown function (DUF5916)
MTKGVFRRAGLGLLLAALFFSPALGQEQGELLGLRIDRPVTVDGDLSEPAWRRAPEARVFLVVPEARPTPERFPTSFKILFDASTLYLGFTCTEPEPEKMAAFAEGRDGDIRSDDAVYVLFESPQDQTNFLVFGMNVLGVPLDALLARDGRALNLGWDGTWRNAARKTDGGWTAEMAVDFSVLGLDLGRDKVVTLAAARVIPRLDSSFWSEPLEPAFRVSELERLRGLALSELAARSALNGYLLPRLGEGPDFAAAGGLEAEHAFSPALAAQLTLNPDFFTVEPDEERVNLTRYEFRLPEKRAFFNRDAAAFDQPLTLFYSKRVGDIVGGLRAAGQGGPFSYTLLASYAKADPLSGLSEAGFSALRLRSDFGRSNVGLTFANRIAGGADAGSAGLDWSLALGPSVRLTGQAAASYGGFARADAAVILRPSFDGPNINLHAEFYQVGERFAENADRIGYIWDDNRRGFATGLVKRVPINGAFLKALHLEAGTDIYWGLDGTLRSWNAGGGLRAELTSRFEIAAHHNREYKLFDADYRNDITRLDVDFNKTERWQAVGLSVTFGRLFDQRFDLIELRKRLLLTRRFTLEYLIQRLNFDLSHESRAEATTINVLRLTNTFSRDLLGVLFFQSSSKLGKLTIHVSVVRRLPPPFGVLTFGLQRGTGPFGMKGTQGLTAFVKFAPVLE